MEGALPLAEAPPVDAVLVQVIGNVFWSHLFPIMIQGPGLVLTTSIIDFALVSPNLPPHPVEPCPGSVDDVNEKVIRPCHDDLKIESLLIFDDPWKARVRVGDDDGAALERHSGSRKKGGRTVTVWARGVVFLTGKPYPAGRRVEYTRVQVRVGVRLPATFKTSLRSARTGKN
jgi:hypothetical protein